LVSPTVDVTARVASLLSVENVTVASVSVRGLSGQVSAVRMTGLAPGNARLYALCFTAARRARKTWSFRSTSVDATGLRAVVLQLQLMVVRGTCADGNLDSASGAVVSLVAGVSAWLHDCAVPDLGWLWHAPKDAADGLDWASSTRLWWKWLAVPL
jgi:hypothetical protein